MNELAGTSTLVRLALHRSRVLIGVWLAVFVGMAALSSSATVDLYPTAADRLQAADAVNQSSALVAFYGRIYDPTSIGAIAMIKMGGIGAVFVAMLAVVLVVRHTRADEEAGRTELLGATATGRLAPLAAALTVVALTSVALAVLTAAGLAATGLPVDGSIAFGLAWAGVGLAFGAIAAVIVQLTPSARTATSLSAGVLAAVYLVRAVGDAADEAGPRWLSWLSPIGWGQQFRPFAGNRWWVLLITLGFTAVVGIGAFALAARRDLGTGAIPTRPGPATASPGLRSSLALAWRLHRVSFIGWAVGFAGMGALLGNLASNVESFMGSEQAREFFTKLGGEKALMDAFLAVELSFAGIVAAAYGISVIVRLGTEEHELRTEPVLATAVSRIRWAGGHIAVAVGGTAALLVLAGVSAGLAHGAAIGDLGETGQVVVAALVQLPAALVLVAIAIAGYGLGPRATTVGWIALAAFVLLAELGPLLNLSQWVLDLSPFAHVPKLPGGAFTATPVVALSLVAVAIVAAGLARYRHRDIV